jgi:hypothetical protein
MTTSKLLGACCMCDKIRTDDKNDLWISRDENPELYDNLVKAMPLTHGYCPTHFEEAKKELKRYKLSHESSQ